MVDAGKRSMRIRSVMWRDREARVLLEDEDEDPICSRTVPEVRAVRRPSLAEAV